MNKESCPWLSWEANRGIDGLKSRIKSLSMPEAVHCPCWDAVGPHGLLPQASLASTSLHAKRQLLQLLGTTERKTFCPHPASTLEPEPFTLTRDFTSPRAPSILWPPKCAQSSRSTFSPVHITNRPNFESHTLCPQPKPQAICYSEF